MSAERLGRVFRCAVIASLSGLVAAHAQEIVSTWLPGAADSPDPVLEEVRRLEDQGRVWNVRVAESFPVQIHVTGPWETVQQLKALAGISYYGTIGEALTSADHETGIVAAYRLFSVPTFLRYCTSAPERLVVHNAPLSLRPGEPFPLDRIIITAEDGTGRVLPGVPIRLDAEATTPPIVDLRAFALADGELKPIVPGTFGLRAQTLCPETTAVVDFRANVQAVAE